MTMHKPDALASDPHQHPSKAARESLHKVHRYDSFEEDESTDAESQLEALVDVSREIDDDSLHLKSQQLLLIRHRFHLRAVGLFIIVGLFVACAAIVMGHPCHHRSGLAIDAIRSSVGTARATDPRRSRGDGIYRLPPATRLSWSHSRCTREEVAGALADDAVSAIESDVLMGHVVASGVDVSRKNETEPDLSAEVSIMAHPPATTGDLSVRDYLEMVSYPVGDEDKGNSGGRRLLRKHIKLDFKSIDAVKPALDAIADLGIFMDGSGGRRRSVLDQISSRADDDEGLNPRAQRPLFSSVDGMASSNGRATQKSRVGKTLFLNANVLAGPGHRWGPQDTWLNGDEFLNICLRHSALNRETQEARENAKHDEDGFSFSLGYVTDNTAVHGFSESDVQAMMDLVARHNLTGVVVAVNARILAKDPAPFDVFFDAVPSSQLLAWTGKFLLPISRRGVDKTKAHFREKGTVHRVGFDSEISNSFLMGFIYDALYTISSALLYFLKALITWFYMINGKVC